MNSEMAKSAEVTQLEDVFKEPAKQKDAAKEEIKCEDFSIILAQWKASSRKSVHPSGGISLGRPSVQPKEPFLPGKPPAPSIQMESAVSTVVMPASASTTAAPPAPSAEQLAAEDKGKKASMFWSAMKNKGSTVAAFSVRPSFHHEHR